MGDTSKWLRILRNQKKESQIELSRVRLEYDAQILILKKENEWLSDKLIETQRQLRLLTYEIEKKEGVIDGLSSDLRRTQKFRRSASQEKAIDENIPSEAGVGIGDFIEHNLAI